MKKQDIKPSVESLIDQLEQSLSETYGTRFVIDLQEMAGLHTMREYFGKGAVTTQKRDLYASMLKGAWYAANEKKK